MARSEVSEGIRNLRIAIGDTQQQFANRLDLAMSTVVRYESSREPRGTELARFWRLAMEQRLPEYAEVFAKAMGEELEMRAERIPRTIEESLYVDLLFLLMRNRDKLPGLDKSLAQVERVFFRCFKQIDESLQSGDDIVGLNEDDATLLREEVKHLNRTRGVEDKSQ